jgi:chemotaxis protein methyltransferase CheR
MAERASSANPFELTKAQYEIFRRIIYEYAGINLGDDKKELLHARLGKVMRRRGIRGYDDFLALLMKDDAGEELVGLLDAISTNVTHFFREEEHFALLTEKLTEYGPSGYPRIWSAGCSSGEEPYSIAITLIEHGPKLSPPAPCILATDLSTRMLEAALAGIYPASSVKNLNQAMLNKYFLKGVKASEGKVQVKPEVMNMVVFSRLNLMDPFEFYPPFRFIFCRNVMIYFDIPTREGIIEKFHRSLEPGGYLIVGHSESLRGIHHTFQYIRPTVYKKG